MRYSKNKKSGAMRPKLSIVIPAYKEAATIHATMGRLYAFLISRRETYGTTQVIISVGDSPDDTLAIARKSAKGKLGFEVIDAGRPSGKGHNVKVGVQHSAGEKVVYMDADLATPLYHLDKTFHMLDDFDVVNGERDITKIHGDQPHRKLISKLGNRLVQTLLLPGFRDTQCGFKGFKSNTAKRLFSEQTIDRWGFDMELLALSRHYGARITSLPILDWKDMAGGDINESPTKAFKAAFMTLSDLFRIRLMFLRGQYGKMVRVVTAK